MSLGVFSRKVGALSQDMKITYFDDEFPQCFKVGVLGSRKIPYILDFSLNKVGCSCPDYERKKNLCKHIYFVIHLSKNIEIFDTINCLEDITQEKLDQVRDHLKNIIDKKKLEKSIKMNTICIERDDYCAICIQDLKENISKCQTCQHVIHDLCLNEWWKISKIQDGMCPYCKDLKGFPQIEKTSDPWDNFAM